MKNKKTNWLAISLAVGLVLGVGVMTAKKITLPRGIRNKNPLNVKHGNNWQGEENGIDKIFETFSSHALGIRAGAIILINYFNLHKLDTLAKIINRFAPSSENKTTNYIEYVSKRVGIGATTQLTQTDFLKSLPAIIKAMIEMEQGKVSARLINDAEIQKGIALAKAAKGLNNV